LKKGDLGGFGDRQMERISGKRYKYLFLNMLDGKIRLKVTRFILILHLPPGTSQNVP
jgi:hypothetical protein